MDYSDKIDAETWAFIKRTDTYYPPDAVNLSIADQRRVYDDMCRAFFQGYPDGVTARDIHVGDVPCRLYETGTPSVTVMYFHGGGFVVGGLDSHDDVCAEICERTGYRVLSVDYRMAPEHKHPAAYDACRAATEYAARTWHDPVVLAGDSAGGNLAAAVAHMARGTDLPIVGQVLIYPGLGGDWTQGSYITHAEAPLLTTRDIEFYKGVRCEDGQEPVGDPTYAPLHDSDFSALPPTIIISAECDPLSDDGREYRDALRAAGVRALWVNEAGLVHGYLRARATVARARDSFTRIVNAIADLGRGDFPQ